MMLFFNLVQSLWTYTLITFYCILNIYPYLFVKLIAGHRLITRSIKHLTPHRMLFFN